MNIRCNIRYEGRKHSNTITDLRVICKYNDFNFIIITIEFTDQPVKPLIQNGNVSATYYKPAGPYKEGDNLDLVCTNMGGYPEPLLSWFIDYKPTESNCQR